MSATHPRGHSLSGPLASSLPAGSSRLVGVPLVVRPPRCRLPSASPSRSPSRSSSSRSSSSRSSFPLARETRFFTGRQREQGEGGLGLVAICAVMPFVAPEGCTGRMGDTEDPEVGRVAPTPHSPLALQSPTTSRRRDAFMHCTYIQLGPAPLGVVPRSRWLGRRDFTGRQRDQGERGFGARGDLCRRDVRWA